MAQLIIAATMIMGMLVAMSAEDQQAYAIDDQSENRDKDRLVESDYHRRYQPCGALPAMTKAKRTSITALANPASELTLPVPKLNRASLAWRRA